MIGWLISLFAAGYTVSQPVRVRRWRCGTCGRIYDTDVFTCKGQTPNGWSTHLEDHVHPVKD